jgi:predicted nucleic acid-binding protein
MKPDSGPTTFVFDCNLWIEIFLENRIDILDTLTSQRKYTLVSSYGIVEILRVLKRIARRSSVNPVILENKFWALLNHPCIQKEYNHPITETFIAEIKKLPEYMIIAKTFGLEYKDVPYIVLSFQFNAEFVTKDERSILVSAKKIEETLGLKVRSWHEFLRLLGLNKRKK